MKWTVVWEPAAEAELTRLYVQVRHKRPVSASANRIDAALRIDPQQRGHPHIGATRFLMDPPLCVLFRVEEADRQVVVQAVWYFDPYTMNGQANGQAS